MRIICLESPFKPTDDEIKQYLGRYTAADLLRQNIAYARLCLLDALKRGEAPLASHLLYTQVWSELDELRAAGIKAGVEMHHRADAVALYVDLGTSSGMRRAHNNALLVGTELVTRTILDLTDGRDARQVLAHRKVDAFPYLTELENACAFEAIRLERA